MAAPYHGITYVAYTLITQILSLSNSLCMQNINQHGGSFKKYHPQVIFFEAPFLQVYIFVYTSRPLNHDTSLILSSFYGTTVTNIINFTQFNQLAKYYINMSNEFFANYKMYDILK